MSKIKISDMGGEKKLTAEDLSSVKGGPAYIKLGDIKGEVAATSGRSNGNVTLKRG